VRYTFNIQHDVSETNGTCFEKFLPLVAVLEMNLNLYFMK